MHALRRYSRVCCYFSSARSKAVLTELRLPSCRLSSSICKDDQLWPTECNARAKSNSGSSWLSYACASAMIGAAGLLWMSTRKASCRAEPVLADIHVTAVHLDTGTGMNEKENSGSHSNADVKADDDKEVHKSKAGFKERKIMEYENRLRAYSTPDKVFRYFATLQDAESHVIYMTPEDFVRSLTPDTMQPKGFGLDEFKKFEKKAYWKSTSKNSIPNKDSVFQCFDGNGLISFSDYIFLLTVLGTSARHIDIAFRMFDLNGDGEVTADEFDKVRGLFLSMSSTGMRHRDHKTTGNVLDGQINTGIMSYFFDADGTAKLTVEKFVEFKRLLQHEVMELEGITFADYLNFFDFLLNIRDVDMALSFHTVSGHGIDPVTFQRVAKTVAGVDLRTHLVDVVFRLFDDNDDGQLSNKEFVAVMKDKLCRGLNRPKDTGLTRFLGAVYVCAKDQVVDMWRNEDT